MCYQLSDCEHPFPVIAGVVYAGVYENIKAIQEERKEEV
jgi:hypothetical protein